MSTFAYSPFVMNTVSEQARTESQYFSGYRKDCDIAKRARIEFLVGTGEDDVGADRETVGHGTLLEDRIRCKKNQFVHAVNKTLFDAHGQRVVSGRSLHQFRLKSEIIYSGDSLGSGYPA